jgi:ribosome-associated translation inhibitor RaiA
VAALFLFSLYRPRESAANAILIATQGGVSMADKSRFTIICPCCEANLTVDAQTGVIISHEEKAKPLASFDEMVKGLDKQKQLREQIFAQELSSMKDRDRILEEKFQEAMKRADKDKDKPYRNPLDID